jgi:tight adherence protein B
MLVPGLVFILVAGAVVGGYLGVLMVRDGIARRRLERRLQELSQPSPVPDESSIVLRPAEGPVPLVERALGRTRAGFRLATLIEQAGVRTTPGAIVLISGLLAVLFGVVGLVLLRVPAALLVLVPLGAAAPVLWLVKRRSSRLKAFEEQFPEALDLVSRAIRAGHSFQAALGMVADELKPPVGPEFRKMFDQQNFGLPLREALEGLAARVPIVDVKFFVTAVTIQRETGGNLAEILDSLSAVVRERFKIKRQVRVHTAHGRVTGLVLLALPVFLAVALSVINPDHMRPLFQERMGQTMIVATIVMQAIGFVWIRRVIRIEV